MKALTALPEYAGKEAELKMKSRDDLKKLWEGAMPKAGDVPTASEASTDAEDGATGDDDAES